MVSNKLKSKVQAAQMKYLRKIQAVTRLDWIKNEKKEKGHK